MFIMFVYKQNGLGFQICLFLTHAHRLQECRPLTHGHTLIDAWIDHVVICDALAVLGFAIWGQWGGHIFIWGRSGGTEIYYRAEPNRP